MLRLAQGGGQTLAYFTRASAPPTAEGAKLFKAAIAASPCLTLTHPKPKIVRWTGAKLALIRPYQLISADVGVEVSTLARMSIIRLIFLQNITRNTAVREAYAKDPLIKKMGTLKGLDDMLSGVSLDTTPQILAHFLVIGREAASRRLSTMAEGASTIHHDRYGRLRRSPRPVV